jgi:hypothetical protein
MKGGPENLRDRSGVVERAGGWAMSPLPWTDRGSAATVPEHPTSKTRNFYAHILYRSARLCKEPVDARRSAPASSTLDSPPQSRPRMRCHNRQHLCFIEDAKKESIGAIVDIKKRWPEKK